MSADAGGKAMPQWHFVRAGCSVKDDNNRIVARVNTSWIDEPELCARGELIADAPRLRDLNARLVRALQSLDKYFLACVKAWVVDEGRVVNEQGHTIVEAEGLDELCDAAGFATRSALAACSPADLAAASDDAHRGDAP